MSDVNVSEDKKIFETNQEHWDECETENVNGVLVLKCYCGFFNWYNPRRIRGRKLHISPECELVKGEGGKIHVDCHCTKEPSVDRR